MHVDINEHCDEDNRQFIQFSITQDYNRLLLLATTYKYSPRETKTSSLQFRTDLTKETALIFSLH